MLSAAIHDVDPDKAKIFVESASKAMLVAYRVSKKVDDVGLSKNTTPEQIGDQAGRISQLYRNRWVSNKDATGHGSDDFFKSETEVCLALMGMLDE